MVIVDLMTQYGPHRWYYSHVFVGGCHYYDFLRIRKAHEKLPRNEYILTNPEPEEAFFERARATDVAFWNEVQHADS